MKKYGLWDSQDLVWLGDETGPYTYQTQYLADYGRELIASKLGRKQWYYRIEVHEFEIIGTPERRGSITPVY